MLSHACFPTLRPQPKRLAWPRQRGMTRGTTPTHHRTPSRPDLGREKRVNALQPAVPHTPSQPQPHICRRAERARCVERTGPACAFAWGAAEARCRGGPLRTGAGHHCRTVLQLSPSQPHRPTRPTRPTVGCGGHSLASVRLKRCFAGCRVCGGKGRAGDGAARAAGRWCEGLPSRWCGRFCDAGGRGC